jgi:hypothetical protein
VLSWECIFTCYFELSPSYVTFLILCCKDVSTVTSVILLNSSYFVTMQCEMSAALIWITSCKVSSGHESLWTQNVTDYCYKQQVMWRISHAQLIGLAFHMYLFCEWTIVSASVLFWFEYKCRNFPAGRVHVQACGAPEPFLIVGIMILHILNHHLYRLILFVVCEPLFTGAIERGLCFTYWPWQPVMLLLYLKAGINF